MVNEAEAVIQQLRIDYGIKRFLHGDCFNFFKIMRRRFPKARAWYELGHTWVEIDGVFYDIRGKRDKPPTDCMFPSISSENWLVRRVNGHMSYGLAIKAFQYFLCNYWPIPNNEPRK